MLLGAFGAPDRSRAWSVSRAMNGSDEILARLVAELQKAVIGQELHRGRRPAERKTRRRQG